MSCICLIPSIRDSATLANAVTSAEQDGWKTEVCFDPRRFGASKTREALLNRSFVNPEIQFLRYLDDDDLLLPHREAIQQAFDSDPSVELIYTDAIMNMPSGVQHRLSHTGDPYEDVLQVHPWSWVIRTSAARRIKDTFAYFWDYDRPYREGSYVWLKLLQGRVKMRYLPVLGYQYNKSFNPSCISQHPEFVQATKALVEELKNRPAQTQG